jgi:REP element-mobilizing transposase RayT
MKPAPNSDFLIFAYVIMPDHIHLLTSQPVKVSDLFRGIKGTVGRRIIEYLKKRDFRTSLEKMRHQDFKTGRAKYGRLLVCRRPLIAQ